MKSTAENLFISPTEYFKTQVDRASENLKVMLGDEIEFYIVNLLCDFIHPEKINPPDSSGNVLDTPLVFLMKKAHESSDPIQKMSHLKCLGDTSLYVAGYFQDYFNRKLFDISYYIEMGAMAYEGVFNISQKTSSKREVYKELSANFPQLVDVVAEVSEENKPDTDRNILSIYDRWNQSNSQRLRKILEESGIDPIQMPKKLAQ